MWWLALALVSAADLEAGWRFVGFHHVHGADTAWPLGPAALDLHNGHTALAVVWVDGRPAGELLPQTTGQLVRVTAGPHAVAWHLPGGVVREASVDAR